MPQSLYFLSSLREDTKKAEEKIDTILSWLTVTDKLSFTVLQRCIFIGHIRELKAYFAVLSDINVWTLHW